MVVQTVAAAPLLAPVRKNRRKISKKKVPHTADPALGDEVDIDSQPIDGPSTFKTSAAVGVEPNEGVDDDAMQEDDDELMIDPNPASASLLPNTNSSAPIFDAAPASAVRGSLKSETRRLPIPPHRFSPLKKDWVNIFGPLTEILGLQVRMNVPRKAVEIRVRLYYHYCICRLGAYLLFLCLQTSKHTKEIGALQKGADFVKAFALGFDVNVCFWLVYLPYILCSKLYPMQDAIALLRLDDLYLDSFEIKDVKTLHGDHLSRAIGKLSVSPQTHGFLCPSLLRTVICPLPDHRWHCIYRPDSWPRRQDKIHHRKRKPYTDYPRRHVSPVPFIYPDLSS